MDVFFILQFILAIAITILVMLQKSSSIGLGAYSSSNESVFGAKGPANFLVKATYALGFLFVINTVALGYYYNKSHNQSIIDNIEIPSSKASTKDTIHPPRDIVLDYHLGSGTTAAVAHKMGRQYIGIEQMDYIEDITVERLKKVIAGEQGGISKSVAWNGGGAFLYFELKKYNQAFLETIMRAKTTEELMQLRDKILSYACIDYRLDTQSIQQHDAAFTALKLHEQQKILCEFLDLNQLYVNYTEREDAHFACTDHEKHISTTFYASNA